MIKGVAYCRYSSDNQREESIEAQIRAIKEYCIKNDISLIKIYSDEAKTGTNDNREQFIEMINDSSKHTFEVVIVHKLDRFARNRYDSAFYKKKLKDNGVKLISVLEPLDDSPESIILESVLEGMAEYYSKNLAREVMKGLKENALNAKHNGGIPPLGYDVNEHMDYIINENEAMAVKEIFNQYLCGYGYGLIAQKLNNQGQRTKLGRLFTKNSIRDILLNEKYTGTYVYNKRLSKKVNHKYKEPDKIIKVENALPVIISKEDFKKVQALISENRRGPRMDKKEYYLLTGKLECGECNSAYVGGGYVYDGSRTNKYYIYTCVGRKKNGACSNKPIRKDQIEAYVIAQLKNNIFKDTAIEEITKLLFEKVNTLNTEYAQEQKYLQEQQKQVQSKINKTFDMFFDESIPKDILSQKTNELKKQLDDINERLEFIEHQDYSWLNEKKIKLFLEASRADLESDDPLTQRKVIETFVDKIKIYPDRIDCRFKIEASDSDKVGGDKACITLSLSATKDEMRQSLN